MLAKFLQTYELLLQYKKLKISLLFLFVQAFP